MLCFALSASSSSSVFESFSLRQRHCQRRCRLRTYQSTVKPSPPSRTASSFSSLIHALYAIARITLRSLSSTVFFTPTSITPCSPSAMFSTSLVETQPLSISSSRIVSTLSSLRYAPASPTPPLFPPTSPTSSISSNSTMHPCPLQRPLSTSTLAPICSTFFSALSSLVSRSRRTCMYARYATTPTLPQIFLQSLHTAIIPSTQAVFQGKLPHPSLHLAIILVPTNHPHHLKDGFSQIATHVRSAGNLSTRSWPSLILSIKLRPLIHPFILHHRKQGLLPLHIVTFDQRNISIFTNRCRTITHEYICLSSTQSSFYFFLASRPLQSSLSLSVSSSFTACASFLLLPCLPVVSAPRKRPLVTPCFILLFRCGPV